MLSEREGIDIGRTTLRRILVNAGLSSPRQRRPPKHRVRRQRMPRAGMLIQLDGSYHRWLGDDGPQCFDKATTSRLHLTGKLPPELQIEQLPNGRYYVVVPPANEGRCVVYARVWSADQKEDLDRQVGSGRGVGHPTGSTGRMRSSRRLAPGLNGNRRRLRRLVADHTVGTIVVEHRERLSRFGFEYVEAALAGRGARILVMDEAELEDDLVRDATEVMTSLCARLYGRRSARRRAERALAAAREG